MERMARFRAGAILAIGLVVAAGLVPALARAQQKVQVEFWHGLTQPLGGIHPDIVSLGQRAEGWIAGLQMAALALQDETDPHRFVAAFSGDDRHIADYLRRGSTPTSVGGSSAFSSANLHP